MIPKLLIICGPTATGKTDLGIRLAQKFNGEIVSADARQIYKGLNAATGKQYDTKVKIWGYDLIKPTESFSVSQYITFAKNAIEDIHMRGKLPILVGGTGLYIKGVIDGIETASIAPDETLRNELSSKTTGELYETLKELSIEKAESLNESDRQNPRRLIRAIEVLKSDKKLVSATTPYDTLQLGLTAPLSVLESRVEKNIEKRFEETIKEINILLNQGIKWEDPAMNSLGVRQLRGIFENTMNKNEVLSLWKLEERKYVKRQLTWFKKDTRIEWIDITDTNFLEKVDLLVETWDNKK